MTHRYWYYLLRCCLFSFFFFFLAHSLWIDPYFTKYIVANTAQFTSRKNLYTHTPAKKKRPNRNKTKQHNTPLIVNTIHSGIILWMVVEERLKNIVLANRSTSKHFTYDDDQVSVSRKSAFNVKTSFFFF